MSKLVHKPPKNEEPPLRMFLAASLTPLFLWTLKIFNSDFRHGGGGGPLELSRGYLIVNIDHLYIHMPVHIV